MKQYHRYQHHFPSHDFPESEFITLNIRRVLRAARKQLALTQIEVASRLALDQSAYSRIESGSQMLTAPQWIEFCRLTRISPNSITEGLIEIAPPVSPTELTPIRVGTFKIPQKYGRSWGSKVRDALPYLRYFTTAYGNDRLSDYLENLKIDPDFFINLENVIDLDFQLDLARNLIQNNKLKKNNIGDLVSLAITPTIQGSLDCKYTDCQDLRSLLQIAVYNSRRYDQNFHYAITDSTSHHLDLSVAPTALLDDQNYRDDVLGDFLCRYKKQYLHQFISHYTKTSPNLTETQCHFKGHKKCIYRVGIAK